MNKEVIELLNILENNGYEAYIVGGFPRDFYLGIKTDDYDICTNAKPEEIKKIFSIIEEKFGSMKLIYKNKIFEITTYRKESNYINRNPKVEYINSLKEDLLRRDFTINTICMDKNMKYIDIYNGISDLENKKIKIVGDISTKLKEDPLRILRAIRFATTLGFDIDEDIDVAIKKLSYLVKKLSFFRKKEELNKIFSCNNLKIGLELLKRYKIDIYLEIDINDLVLVNNNFAIWAQINYSNEYSFSKKELIEINIFKEILKLDNINKYHIYYYGYDYCKHIADVKDINIDSNLAINNRKDIDISVDDIINNTKINISEVYILIEKEILLNNLLNKREEIINFIKNI